MSITSKFISFDRPLIAAVVPGQEEPRYTEGEMAVARSAAYHEGYDTARRFADGQLTEFREEVQALQHGVLHSMNLIEKNLVTQLQAGLPSLAIDIARRLLANFEPPAELVVRLCTEALEHLYPERENLELIVCARDAELLTANAPDLAHKYPELKLKVDPTMRPGDCQVKSRFGLTDARLDAKLIVIQHELGLKN